jgi:ankyrin repeat protein
MKSHHVKEFMEMLGIEKDIINIKNKYLECKENFNINDKLYWYGETYHNDTKIELKYYKQNTLVFCCIIGLFQEVNFLLNLNEIDIESDNYYAFRMACYYGHDDIVKLFCDKSDKYFFYIKKEMGNLLIIPIINGKYLDNNGKEMNKSQIDNLKKKQFEDVTMSFFDYI